MKNKSFEFLKKVGVILFVALIIGMFGSIILSNWGVLLFSIITGAVISFIVFLLDAGILTASILGGIGIFTTLALVSYMCWGLCNGVFSTGLLDDKIPVLNVDELNVENEKVNHQEVVEADITKANITEADITKANITEADITKANITEANITKANITEANITKANITEANITKANITEANITKANISIANISTANISKAYISEIITPTTLPPTTTTTYSTTSKPVPTVTNPEPIVTTTTMSTTTPAPVVTTTVAPVVTTTTAAPIVTTTTLAPVTTTEKPKPVTTTTEAPVTTTTPVPVVTTTTEAKPSAKANFQEFDRNETGYADISISIENATGDETITVPDGATLVKINDGLYRVQIDLQEGSTGTGIVSVSGGNIDGMQQYAIDMTY